MKNKILIVKKTERAKRIVSMCKDINPPLWAVIWLKRHTLNGEQK